MDNAEISPNVLGDCLRDLEFVNKLTLAYRPIKRWLHQILRKQGPTREMTILDVGSGGGDSLRFISRLVGKCYPHIKLTGVDLNPHCVAYARPLSEQNASIDYHIANIFDYPTTQKFDFVISSLFTHHLTDVQLLAFIQWMEVHTDKGWFINDLHRHPIAFFGFRWLSKICGLHYMIQHDGPISVARAFVKQDWIDLLASVGLDKDKVEIRWSFPFRYCLTRSKQ